MIRKKLKKIPSKNGISGITLIALVVTIIVLLILAGVSIATLTGENGMLKRTNNAKTSTEIGEEREKVELSAVGALVKDNGVEIKRNYLNDELTSYIGTEGIDYSLSESETAPFVVKYLDSGRSYLINKDGNVSEYVDISEYVKIGDYVDYIPDEETTVYDKFGDATYTGTAGGGNVGQDTTLKWRVLNINIDGTVDLISDKPITKQTNFNGARGYNNGVYLLNDYCNTMYNNTSKGAVARSLNIEDIQDKMKIDEETHKKAYQDYESATTKTKYGETYSYSSYKKYPLQWKSDNGIYGGSKQETVKSYASESVAIGQELGDWLTVTQTYWTLTRDVMESNFVSADTRDTSKSNSMYYELLCNKGSGSYWLASRYVNANGETMCGFGLFYICSGYTCLGGLATSGGNTGSNPSSGFRPVVNLRSPSINVDAGYNEENGWSLK